METLNYKREQKKKVQNLIIKNRHDPETVCEWVDILCDLEEEIFLLLIGNENGNKDQERNKSK